MESAVYSSPLKNDSFGSAANAFNSGNYSKAIDFFKKTIKQRGLSGELAFNIGTCCYMQKKYSRALLWYKKAGKYLFNDTDLKFNMKKTYEKLGVSKDVSGFTINRLFPESLFVVSAVLFEIFFFLLLLFTPLKKLRKIKVMMLVFLTIFLSVSFYNYSSNIFNKKAVIFEKIDVYSADSYNAAVLFQLKKGTVVSIEEYKDGFYKITASKDRPGWIPEKYAGII